MTLKEAIKLLGQDPGAAPTILIGEVTKFDATKWLATVKLNAGWTDDDIRVKAVINSEDSGILVEPKIGSFVLCAQIENKKESLVVIAWSEIVRFRIIADLTELNGDQFGGTVKSEVVASEIAELKSDINMLKQLIASWTPVPQDGGLALRFLLQTWSGQSLTAKNKQDFENPKVKHG